MLEVANGRGEDPVARPGHGMLALVGEVVAFPLGEEGYRGEDRVVVVEIAAGVRPLVTGEDLEPRGLAGGRGDAALVEPCVVRVHGRDPVVGAALGEGLLGGRHWSGRRQGGESALQAEGEAAEERVLEAQAGYPIAEPIVLGDDLTVVGKTGSARDAAAAVLTLLAATASFDEVDGVAPTATRSGRGASGCGGCPDGLGTRRGAR